jgi:hypothetical protein
MIGGSRLCCVRFGLVVPYAVRVTVPAFVRCLPVRSRICRCRAGFGCPWWLCRSGHAIGVGFSQIEDHALGGFNRSSQHLEAGGVWRWVSASGNSRFGRCAARCGRRGGPRPRGARIGCVSGRRSKAGRRVRTLLRWPGCHRRLAAGGFDRLAGCLRSRWPRCRADTCRSCQRITGARRPPARRPGWQSIPVPVAPGFLPGDPAGDAPGGARVQVSLLEVDAPVAA